MKKLILLSLMLFLIALPIYAEEDLFTEEELKFIEDNPVINIGVDPDFYPFEFIDSDGIYKGIASEYIKIIESMSGLQFKIKEGLTWSEVYEQAVEGQLDALPSLSYVESREQYFLYSEEYYVFQRVIVTEKKINNLLLEDLFGQSVAVQKNSSHHIFLKQFPQIELSFYKTAEDALIAIRGGQEDYFIANLAAASHTTKELGFSGLTFVEIKEGDKNTLHFAINKDLPILRDIIDKCLAEITTEKKTEIKDKWINIEYKSDLSGFLQVIYFIIFIVFITVCVSFFWIKRLKKEIKRRILIEEALTVAKQEAINANNIKSTFIARMSHEIRTPLNAIIGLGHLISEHELSKLQSSYMEKLKHSSETLLSIVNDILDMSKIEAGKMILDHHNFSLDDVISHAINIVASKADEKNLDITLLKEARVPNYLIGDKIRVGQILINLLNNAVKFTDQGSVQLAVSLYGFVRDLYEIEFVITDTGKGISEEGLKTLFQPFIQEDNTITRQYGGSGLGLSIVENLVSLMDGSISVDSQPTKGTQFSVRLKLKVDENKERESKKGLEYMTGIRSIVFSNSLEDLSLIVDYLKQFNIKPEFTSSQAQFTSLQTQESPYDLIVCTRDSISGNLTDFITTNTVNSKLIIIQNQHDKDIIEARKSLYVIQDPFLPSRLYGAIAELFQYKLMASQLDSKVEMNSDVKLIGQVLIVEDNLTNQLIASELLKSTGLVIHKASNGQEAIELVKKNVYQLILMDLHMPVMDGFEATRQIREQSSTPIIAITADALEGIQERCLEVGMNDFISKPFIPNEFTTKVSMYIESTKQINHDEALMRVSNNKDLLRRIQSAFIEENESIIDQIDALLIERNYSELIEVFHKLKNDAGNIGASLIRQHIVEIEKHLKSHDYQIISNHYKIFKSQFETLLSELKETT